MARGSQGIEGRSVSGDLLWPGVASAHQEYNSGCCNCCRQRQSWFGIDEDYTLLLGRPLPMRRVLCGIRQATPGTIQPNRRASLPQNTFWTCSCNCPHCPPIPASRSDSALRGGWAGDLPLLFSALHPGALGLPSRKAERG